MEKKVLVALEARKTQNSLASGAQCQDIETGCEDELERQQHASLPSLGRFEAKYKCASSPGITHNRSTIGKLNGNLDG